MASYAAMTPIVKTIPDGLIEAGKPLTFFEQYQTPIMIAVAAVVLLKIMH